MHKNVRQKWMVIFKALKRTLKIYYSICMTKRFIPNYYFQKKSMNELMLNISMKNEKTVRPLIKFIRKNAWTLMKEQSSQNLRTLNSGQTLLESILPNFFFLFFRFLLLSLSVCVKWNKMYLIWNSLTAKKLKNYAFIKKKVW